MLLTSETTDLDRGPRAKPGSARTCVVSRQVKGTDELIRFVLSPAGEVVPDVRRKLPGRGLWVSLSRTMVAEAAKRGLFAKAFKRAVMLPPDLAAQTDTLLARSVLDEVIARLVTFPDAVGAGRIKVSGNALKLGELMMLMDEFPRMFEIVEPKRAVVT